MSDEIHVGDIGTLYSVPVLDDFDVDAAVIVQLIFSFPLGQIAVRTATVAHEGANTFLEYQVVEGDVLGSPAEFHQAEGQFIIQSYVAFAGGQAYHSNFVTVDDDDQELRIFPNLN